MHKKSSLKARRILFLPKYAHNAASTRYRVIQYIPYLKSLNIDCAVVPLLSEAYLKVKFKTGKTLYFEILKGFLKRIWVVLWAAKYDLVVIYCEALPYFPAILEKYLKLRRIPYVFDFDDAIFHAYGQHKYWIVRWVFRKKIGVVVGGARQVVAGNRYLAQYAEALNSNVRIIPTVVDTNRYPEKKYTVSAKNKFTIGWIGSPSTAVYLKTIGKILQQFSRDHDVRIILVGSGPINIPNLTLEIRQWAENTEIRDIQDFDVGIMPLPDTLWARGKCGFKLIQYMACGLPVIASCIGANKEIIDNNKNGFLVESSEEWYNALAALYKDVNLRKSMGSAGRLKAIQQYSLQSVAHSLSLLLTGAIEK
ncbi:MAG TPA: glycosyl transferase family 1 [Candidatus Omnitrophica bacterium]|nr:glycosyl transferase family 1 [Candidatus Omnitrophota bacterium]